MALITLTLTASSKSPSSVYSWLKSGPCSVARMIMNIPIFAKIKNLIKIIAEYLIFLILFFNKPAPGLDKCQILNVSHFISDHNHFSSSFMK